MHDLGLILFSALALVLLLLPLRLHWRARNAGTLINIAWLFLGNLVFLINAIIWWDSYEDVAPIWCDIAIKVQVGLLPGLTASSLLINKRLATIAASRSVSISQRQKRITLAIDVLIGLGLPMLIMALSYIVQPHRFNIMEGYGCEYPVWPSLPAIFLVYWWGPLLSFISVIYGCIAIRFFLARRLQFKSLLKSSQSGLDTNQYFRLIALAGTDLLLGLPITTWSLVRMTRTLYEWTSWSDVHYGWSYVHGLAANDSTFDVTIAIDEALPRWLFVIMAYMFFIFFGISEDAIGEYLGWFRSIRSRFSRSPNTNSIDSLTAPKLGSTVVQPKRLDWDGFSRDDKRSLHSPDHNTENSLLPLHASPKRGFSVAVTVEREIV